MALIASYPKSGNTWLRVFLNCYLSYRPAAEVLNELGFSSLESPQDFTRTTGADYSRQNISLHWDKYLKRKLASERYIFKTHLPNSFYKTTRLIPVQAKVVHIVRDPRTLVLSVCNHFGFTQEQAVEFMVNENAALKAKIKGAAKNSLESTTPLGSWKSHTESWLQHPGPRLTTRYEDLKNDPEKIFSEIIRFLSIELDLNRLKFALGESDFLNLQKAESAVGFREAPKNRSDSFFRKGGTVKETISDDAMRAITQEAGPLLLRLGYD